MLSYIIGLALTRWDMWDKVGLFHTFEYLGQSVAEVRERGRVKANLSGLSRPVKGTEADTGRNAVDDGLSDLNAGLFVLGGDGESKVNNVGLYSTNSHDGGLSALVRVVINTGRRANPSTRLCLYYTDFF